MVDNALLRKVSDVMDFIHSNWSQVKAYIPDNLDPFDHGFGIGAGACSEPSLIDDDWFTSVGYRRFAFAELPDEFYCLGIQNRGTSEFLFVMWSKDSRRFWFYDQYVVYVGDEFPASHEKTSYNLTLALERWKDSKYDVLFDYLCDGFKLLGFYTPGSDD